MYGSAGWQLNGRQSSTIYGPALASKLIELRILNPTLAFCAPIVSSAGLLASRTPFKPFVIAISVRNNVIVTTFNNGSLGSGIDEERSEMR
jgi:hypothetical protein